MSSKKPTGARSETVRCENCGEYYAVTYKRCPFCEERRRGQSAQGSDFDEPYEEGDYEAAPSRSGGKRLVTNKRGGGYGRAPSPLAIVGTVLSLALIVAAIWIVVTIIAPLIGRGQNQNVSTLPPLPTSSLSPSPSAPVPTSAGEQSPQPTPASTPSPAPTTGVDASPQPSDPIPSTQTADSFTMSGRGDITLDDNYKVYTFKVTFSPAGSTGSLTWSSDRPEIISVDQNGTVTALARGSANVTATMAGGYTQSCIVRSTVSGGGSTASQPSPSQPSSNLTISRSDFTLSFAGDSWKLKVSGTSSTPEWSVGNSEVATVAADGTVTAVSPGRTTVTATVDGQALECIVRCTW